MKHLIYLSLLSLLAGCGSVHLSSPGSLSGINLKGAGACDRVITLDNQGSYLFFSIPLACGDFRWNEKKGEIEGGLAWFSDQANITTLTRALEKYAARENCDVVDIVVRDQSNSPLAASYEGLSGFLFGISQASISAVLRPRNMKLEGGIK